jgi:hypothetical protein
METAAQLENDGIGDRLEMLFSRLRSEGIQVGIRERVTAGRIAAHIVEQQGKLTGRQWAFLLRARLTPILAKSPQEAGRILAAFLEVFPEEEKPHDRRPIPPGPAPRPLSLPRGGQRGWLRFVALVGGLITFIALGVVGSEILPRLFLPTPTQQTRPRDSPTPSTIPGPAPVNSSQATDTLTEAELAAIAQQIVKAAGGNGIVTIAGLARELAAADPSVADARAMISILQRYLAKASGEVFTLNSATISLLVEALASRQFPGRTASADAMAAAVGSSGAEKLPNTPGPAADGTLPPPGETFLIAPGLSAALVGAPGIVLIVWLARRRKRLKDYLRRRTPERPPLVHDLVVHASADMVREGTALTRAALWLGRSREGRSRAIDPEATANATAAAAGFPHVVFAPARTTPQYLVLISTKGPEDHVARQLDRLVEELAAQNLSLIRYFIAYDANLCFDSPQRAFVRIEQLANLYPDYRLIFFGTGDQLLNSGTFAVWPWAEELTSWQRRAILTPKPQKEWGAQEAALAWLFDTPPMRADSEGLLRLAELFERQDPPGGEYVDIRRDPARWSWTGHPQRWLIPLAPDDDDREQLEAELARYFADAGKFDEDCYWWFAACAIYPAVRWDLTIYLGLKLRSPRDGRPLYTDERALQLAVLPWFRDGYMPDWLRMRLIKSLPKKLRVQAVALLRGILDRAVMSQGQAFDAVRLRIAQDRPDPRSARPERDEIFLDVLAGSNPLAFEAPRSLRKLISRAGNEFTWREWTTLVLIMLYWAAAALLVPWPSAGALTTTEWLPLLLLPLVFVTAPAARRLTKWAKVRAERTAAGSTAEKD